MWDDQQGSVVHKIDIQAGQRRQVRVFIGMRDTSDVFVYNAACCDAREALPPGLSRVQRDARDFDVHIIDQIGRRITDQTIC
jgi:hypothetical protein